MDVSWSEPAGVEHREERPPLYVVTFDDRPIWQWFHACDERSAHEQVDSFAAAHALERARVGYEQAVDLRVPAHLELARSLTSRPPVD